MDIYVEDYGYETVDEFKKDLQEYEQEKIDHRDTINVPAPLPKHDIFDKSVRDVLSRVEENSKKEIEFKKEKEKQEKEQQQLIEKQKQDEINKCDVNHPDYKCGIDTKMGMLRPQNMQQFFDLNLDTTNSTNV